MVNKKVRARKCPYCGHRVRYIDALKNLRQGEHTCKRCRKYSNIKFKPTVYLAVILAVFISCIFGFLLYKATLTGVILSLIPFVLLYLCIPFFYMLMPVKMIKKTFKEISEERNRENQRLRNEMYKNQEENVKTYIPKSSKYKNIENTSFNDDNDGSTRYIPDLR